MALEEGQNVHNELVTITLAVSFMIKKLAVCLRNLFLLMTSGSFVCHKLKQIFMQFSQMEVNG